MALQEGSKAAILARSWGQLRASRQEESKEEEADLDFRNSGRFQQRSSPTTSIPAQMEPVPVPPDQLNRSFDNAAEFMQGIEKDHPHLAQAIQNNPDLVHLLPEIGMMLDSPTNIGADVVGGLLDIMPNAVGYRSYAETMYETPVQQTFWNDVASQFDSGAKDIISYLFASLEERGADRVASKAFAWIRNNPITTGEDQANLLVRLQNWAQEEQQTELHDEGIFGALDFLQEQAENLIEVPVFGLISHLQSPEEAIRRSGLTLGQQAMYEFGLDPDDTAWTIGSGALDALGEVVLDPLNVISGVGAGVKAAKTVPLSINAINKGRLALTAKSAIPIFGRFVNPIRTRSWSARVTYALGAKSLDEVFDVFGKSRAGQEAFDLLKAGNRARFAQRFPQLDKLPDTFFDAAKYFNSPDDMSEIMKHVHWHDNFDDPAELNKAIEDLDNANAALGRASEEAAGQMNLALELDPVVRKPMQQLQLEQLRAQMRLDMIKAKPGRQFVVADLPTKAKGGAYNFVAQATQNREGHIANRMRRLFSDLTQSTPQEINLFETRKASTQVRQLLDHYGVETNKADDLINRFISLDPGERQNFMLHTVIPAIGDATKNPLLRYDLVEIYRRAEGVRSFAPGFDEAVDAAGNTVHLPFYTKHLQANFHFPISEVDLIIRRYNRANKLGGVLGMGRRGFLPSTRDNRLKLAQRLGDRMRAKGYDGPTDPDSLMSAAYSWVGGENDARGWISKLIAQPTSNWGRRFNTVFKKSMLGARPMQWMFKVVLLEEQIRAHVFEMAGLYTKPLSWASGMISNHYLNKSAEWAAKQMEWVDNVAVNTLGGVKAVDDAVAAVRATFGKAADDILGDRKFKNAGEVQKRLNSWLHQAALDKVGDIPGSNLIRRHRAWKINQAEGIRAREHLGADFIPKDDLSEIMGKSLGVIFSEEIANAQTVRLFDWKPQMSTYAARSYGHTWGKHVLDVVEDPALKWGLDRMIAREAGTRAPTAEEFLETSTWKLMKGNIRKFFPDEADDVARVNRWFDEKVEPWIEHVLSPVLSQQGVNRMEFLENLRPNRAGTQFKADLNGHAYNINLKAAGAAKRKLADLVVDQSTFAHTTPFPQQLAGVPFDFRFLDEGDRAGWRRGVDNWIKFWGEDATQVLTRRPAWRQQYRKWLNIYQNNMGLPEGLAAQLAREKASQIVNRVMYDISEAPHAIKKVNDVIPFFGALYEVLSTWTYKMPVAVGGWWGLGVGGFARKIDRLMRAMISMGLVRVEPGSTPLSSMGEAIGGPAGEFLQETGAKSYELQLFREPDERDIGNPLGQALSQIGYLMRRGPENAVANIIAALYATKIPQEMFGAEDFDIEAALAMSRDNYKLTVGNPLNPFDFGVLSFAQFHLGLHPAQNWVVNGLAGRLLPAADAQRFETTEAMTLADLADQLDVDPDDLARANRNLVISASSAEAYKGLFTDDVDPNEIIIPEGNLVSISGSTLFETLVDETVYPFGEVETPAGAVRGLFPGMWQHVLRGWGLIGTPADRAMSGDLNTVPFFGQPEDKASINSTLLEAMMYLETTEGLFTKIAELDAQARSMPPGEKADAILDESRRLSDEAVKKATDIAGGSMILRGLGGGLFPNTGRSVRAELDEINKYWNSREFAEQMRGTDADGNPEISVPISRVNNIEDIEEFYDLVATWLDDPTGDDSRTFIRENHPEIFAYLQPKTYWGEAGVPPEISSYDDYLEQIRSGKRKPMPMAVAVQRHHHAGVESDYWSEFVATFGNDPEAAASAALDNIAMFDEMQDERFARHDALMVLDEMHGGEYLEWQRERGQHDDDVYETVEEAQERHREYMDTLGELLDIELDPYMEPAEIRQWRTNIKTTIAKLQDLSTEQDSEESGNKNPYELALRAYWDDIYAGFNEAVDPIWEQIGEATDTNETSLLFEQLKLVTNQWLGRRTLFGREDISYPSPLEVKWNRKTEDEKRAWAMKRATLPLEWLSLDDVQRIMEYAPADAIKFFPETANDFEVYTAWTEKKVEINQQFQRGEITSSQKRDMQDALEEQVISFLRENGRGDEVTYMNLWPVEQLYVTGQLPEQLHYVMPHVRYLKEQAAAEGLKGPRDDWPTPLYQDIINRAYADPAFGKMLVDLGLTLFDESAYNAIVPKLIVGPFEGAF